MPQDLDVVSSNESGILSPETIKMMALANVLVSTAMLDARFAELEAQIDLQARSEPIHETQSGGVMQKPPAPPAPTQLEFDF